MLLELKQLNCVKFFKGALGHKKCPIIVAIIVMLTSGIL